MMHLSIHGHCEGLAQGTPRPEQSFLPAVIASDSKSIPWYAGRLLRHFIPRNDSQQINAEELSMKKQDGFTLFVIPAKAGIKMYLKFSFMKEFYL
jgi:hypothetical protein